MFAKILQKLFAFSPVPRTRALRESFLHFYFCALNSPHQVQTHSLHAQKKMDELAIFEQFELLHTQHFSTQEWGVLLIGSPEQTNNFLQSIIKKSSPTATLISFLNQFAQGKDEGPSWVDAFSILPTHLRLLVLLSKKDTIARSNDFLQEYSTLFIHLTKGAFLEYPLATLLPTQELCNYFEQHYYHHYFYAPSTVHRIKQNDIPFDPELFSISSPLRFSFEDAVSLTIHKYLKLSDVFSQRLNWSSLCSTSPPKELCKFFKQLQIGANLSTHNASFTKTVGLWKIFQTLDSSNPPKWIDSSLWGLLTFPIVYAFLSSLSLPSGPALTLFSMGAGLISLYFLLKGSAPYIKRHYISKKIKDQLRALQIHEQSFNESKRIAIEKLQVFNQHAKNSAIFEDYYNLNLSPATQSVFKTGNRPSTESTFSKSPLLHRPHLVHSLRSLNTYLWNSNFEHQPSYGISTRSDLETTKIFSYSQIQEFNIHWCHHVIQNSSFKKNISALNYVSCAQKSWDYQLLKSSLLSKEENIDKVKKIGFLANLFSFYSSTQSDIHTDTLKKNALVRRL